MLNNPFKILQPFKNKLDVILFIKEDNITSDGQISAALGKPDICSLWQVHGNKTIKVDSPTSRTVQADGMITDKKNLVLTIRTADCQPVLIYAPEQNVAGVLHVGWRGLIAGAIPNFFRAMENGWGIDPASTFVAVGPSLCRKCAGFSDPSNELPNIDPKFIDENNCVDLMGAADKQFLDLGVTADRIERIPDCTSCNPDKYWTYRGGDKEAVIKGHTNVLACCLTTDCLPAGRQAQIFADKRRNCLNRRSRRCRR